MSRCFWNRVETPNLVKKVCERSDDDCCEMNPARVSNGEGYFRIIMDYPKLKCAKRTRVRKSLCTFEIKAENPAMSSSSSCGSPEIELSRFPVASSCSPVCIGLP